MVASKIPILPVSAETVPTAVQERLAVAGQTAEDNCGTVSQRLERSKPLLDTLAGLCRERNLSSGERVRRLRRLADAWAQEVAPSSACRRGCSHCCYIAVAVFGSEAKVMARELKLTLRQLAEGVGGIPAKEEFARDFGYHRPCVFLRAGRCSIYEQRPLACRLHFNMDVDELLCELHPGQEINVPYANASSIQLIAASLFMDDSVADIRDWFP